MDTLPDRALAAVFTAAGEPLELQSLSMPELREGEALARVTCCTVCGSDLHTYQGHRSTPVPTVLGHEILGEIVALGPGGPTVDPRGRPPEIGERVTWSIAASCGRCFFCTHGIPQKCTHLLKYGHEQIRPDYQLSGGLAEYCHLARGTAVIPVPEAVPDEAACPANCATATVAGAFRVSGGCDDAVVLVQGCGMLGLTACAMARARGAREVIACDVDPARLDLASRFGATRCVAVADGDEALTDAARELTDGRGVDLALELSGAARAMEAGLRLLRIGGRYVLVGAVFPSSPLALDPEAVIRRLLTIYGLHNYTPDDLADAVAFLAQHHTRYPFAELVTESFPLAEADRAFQHAIETRALRVAVRSKRVP